MSELSAERYIAQTVMNCAGRSIFFDRSTQFPQQGFIRKELNVFSIKEWRR